MSCARVSLLTKVTRVPGETVIDFGDTTPAEEIVIVVVLPGAGEGAGVGDGDGDGEGAGAGEGEVEGAVGELPPPPPHAATMSAAATAAQPIHAIYRRISSMSSKE